MTESTQEIAAHVTQANVLSDRRPVPPIPQNSKRQRWKRIGIEAFPYAPQDELGVVALFGIFCSKRIIPWQILDLNGGEGIDGVCYDDASGREINVEFKHKLSRTNWNHPLDEVDYVVCWENAWHDFPKKVIELSKLIRQAATQ